MTEKILALPEPEQLKVGDIFLQSSKYCVNQLSSIILELLKDEAVKEYLGLLKENRIKRTSYVGE